MPTTDPKQCWLCGNDAGDWPPELYSDGSERYVCDKCLEDMGRTRFVITPDCERTP